VKNSLFFIVHNLHLKTQAHRIKSNALFLYFWIMKKYMVYLKNKYILTSCIFVVYFLFLDDTDIFTIVNHTRKLNHLEEQKTITSHKLDSTTVLLKRLRHSSELESYAREEKLFKKENEDIFIISYE
jgi:hypothetical protein